MRAPTFEALIVGSEGQDGRVLQNILAKQGKKFYRQSKNIVISPDGKHLGAPTRDLLKSIFKSSEIGQVYFLAATHSPARFNDEHSSEIQLARHFEILQDGMIQILETIKKESPTSRFFFASSALVFGEPKEIPQTEQTTIAPTETYGLFKSIGQEIVTFYRDNLGIFSNSGILYPHESEYRKEQFLFMKIVEAARRASLGSNDRLEIVDPDFTREWNCAYQVMECAKKTLEIEMPADYIIGSGIQESVKEICKLSFQTFDLNFEEFIDVSSAKMIRRSSNLISNPTELSKAIGQHPDGDIKSLISRTYSRMQKV